MKLAPLANPQSLPAMTFSLPTTLRPTLDTLRHQFGMLDEVGDRVDYAGNHHLARRQLHLLKDLPFMLMARIARLQNDSRRTRLEHDVDDLPQLDIVMMRALVVAPAQMHPHRLGRDAGHSAIERLHAQLRGLAELPRGQLANPFWPRAIARSGQSICSSNPA